MLEILLFALANGFYYEGNLSQKNTSSPQRMTTQQSSQTTISATNDITTISAAHDDTTIVTATTSAAHDDTTIVTATTSAAHDDHNKSYTATTSATNDVTTIVTATNSATKFVKNATIPIRPTLWELLIASANYLRSAFLIVWVMILKTQQKSQQHTVYTTSPQTNF
jgi:hypothetical protein